jgi:phosphomannomutase
MSDSSTLVISASGIRGIVGKDLTPDLVTRYAAGLGERAVEQGNPRIVIGRDARTSGEMFAHAAAAGLLSVGCEVIDIGLVPTPTTQLAVEFHQAGGGLVLTASHNPVEWNALKLIGPDGIFLDGAGVADVRARAERGPACRAWDGIGRLWQDRDAIQRHIEAVLNLPLIDVERIRQAGFRVALDCVRGAGGVIIPDLLQRLGCEVSGIHLEADGKFPREPEPLPENLTELRRLVRKTESQLGIAVDPDVDRMALVDDHGVAIGEDYTLAFAVRAVLGGSASGRLDVSATARRGAEPPSRRAAEPPVVVANLSTSLVVEDAARAGGARFVRAPVGESNVARTMIQENALIGGEGNGGVMLPQLHVGRDAPLGVALILQYLAVEGRPVSALVSAAPRYRILKTKVKRGTDLAPIYAKLKTGFPDAEKDERDGLRLGWKDRWVHVRPSGTEPVIRMIAEAPTEAEAQTLLDAASALL